MNIKNKQQNHLKEWILANKTQLTLDSDTIIQEYHRREGLNTKWISSSIIITEYARNTLGALAAIAGDSMPCITVQLIFYNDPTQKRQIMLAAEDSSCLNKLISFKMRTDSTENFIFGVKQYPGY